MSQENNTPYTGKKPTLVAWQVRKSSNGKDFWTRIGAGWTSKNGGFTIQLDVVPLDGRIVCQPPKEKDETPTDAE